ncbi:MAG: hypothetical protein LBJ92_04420 [Holosporales bacterium]|jgi:hypothetical protein|nr:hypothetical protein [Holosporales bacterium]
MNRILKYSMLMLAIHGHAMASDGKLASALIPEKVSVRDDVVQSLRIDGSWVSLEQLKEITALLSTDNVALDAAVAPGQVDSKEGITEEALKYLYSCAKELRLQFLTTQMLIAIFEPEEFFPKDVNIIRKTVVVTYLITGGREHHPYLSNKIDQCVQQIKAARARK